MAFQESQHPRNKNGKFAALKNVIKAHSKSAIVLTGTVAGSNVPLIGGNKAGELLGNIAHHDLKATKSLVSDTKRELSNNPDFAKASKIEKLKIAARTLAAKRQESQSDQGRKAIAGEWLKAHKQELGGTLGNIIGAKLLAFGGDVLGELVGKVAHKSIAGAVKITLDSKTSLQHSEAFKAASALEKLKIGSAVVAETAAKQGGILKQEIGEATENAVGAFGLGKGTRERIKNQVKRNMGKL